MMWRARSRGVRCLVACLCLSVAWVAAQPAPEAPPRVGVFYFPGWKEGALGLAYPRPWEPIKRFPEREPLLGWYDEGQPAVMEQHLSWMAGHGLDYVVFDWYWGGGRPVLDHALKAYVASAGKAKVNYAVMWANHDAQPAPAADIVAMVAHLARHHFRRPEYLKIDGKPLLFIMLPGKLGASAQEAALRHDQMTERMQAAAQAAGLPGLMLVAGAGGGANAVTQNARRWGYAAYFIYNYSAGIAGTRGQPRETRSYEELDEAYREHWDWFMKRGDLPYVVPMSSGWDSRPWGGSADPLRDRSVSTVEQFRVHLAAAHDVIRRNPTRTLGLGLVCCWNEFGEGSYIEPTKLHGMRYLEAMKSVFGRR